MKIRRPQGREGSIPSARTTLVLLRGPGWNHPGMLSSRTRAASALAQSGGVWRFCIRTYSALLVAPLLIHLHHFVSISLVRQVPEATHDFNDCSPEKADVGGSIPPLATTFQQLTTQSVRVFIPIHSNWHGGIRLFGSADDSFFITVRSNGADKSYRKAIVCSLKVVASHR
jgi:hypothetical protein